MERVVKCPHCGSEDHCFEEQQDNYNSYMCFNCGYMSDTRFNDQNEEQLDANQTILTNKIKYFDEDRGIWWFPSVINMGKLGIIYPDGTEDEWNWKFAKPIPIPEHKKEALNNYENMLDVDNATSYDKMNFFQAVQDMGIVKDLNKTNEAN